MNFARTREDIRPGESGGRHSSERDGRCQDDLVSGAPRELPRKITGTNQKEGPSLGLLGRPFSFVKYSDRKSGRNLYEKENET
jgi:hypothetical protein